jgi:hypothetical protein
MAPHDVIHCGLEGLSEHCRSNDDFAIASRRHVRMRTEGHTDNAGIEQTKKLLRAERRRTGLQPIDASSNV